MFFKRFGFVKFCLFLILFTLLGLSAPSFPRCEVARGLKAAETMDQGELIFSDNFKRRDVFSTGQWIVRAEGERNNFSTAVTGGRRVLKAHNPGSGLRAITYYPGILNLKGVVSVDFYDNGDDRSAGSVVSIGNFDDEVFLMFMVKGGEDYYTYRIHDRNGDYQAAALPEVIERSVGWHKFEFVVTEFGSYGRIDGIPLSELGLYAESGSNRKRSGINQDLTEISTVNLGRGWSYEGDTYFDNVEVRTLFEVPSSSQEIIDNWSDEVYRIYKDTDFSSLWGEGGIDTGNYRVLAGQAMMHLYYYYRDGNPADLVKAEDYLRVVVDRYPSWGKRWLSGIPTMQLGFSSWWSWQDLDPHLRADIFSLTTEEADFWSWALEEIKERPYDDTIPQKAVGGSDSTPGRTVNLGMISSQDDGGGQTAPWDEVLTDTRTEENAGTLLSVALAYSMFPHAATAEKWDQATQGYAFHVFTRGEADNVGYGIRSRTITDTYSLCNHGICPNPGYTTAGVNPLQHAQLFYLLAGKLPPQSFYHNIAEGVNSPVWDVNVTDCLDPDTFRIKEKCHAGDDWGDTRIKYIAMMLAYFESLQDDSEAVGTLDEALRYWHLTEKDLIRYPKAEPVSTYSSDEYLYWWKNIEHHAQISPKVYALEQRDNPEFRAKHFPSNPQVCEENIFKEMVWSGEMNWDCDQETVKKGESSLRISSDSYSNAEVYSPLQKVEPERTYKVSYWVKTENLQVRDAQVYGRIIPAQYGAESWESDTVRGRRSMEEVNSSVSGRALNHRYNAGFSSGDNVGGTTNWQYREYSFKTESDTAYVRFRAPIGLMGRASGTVWFDEVRLEKTVGLPSLKLEGYCLSAVGVGEDAQCYLEWNSLPEDMLDFYALRVDEKATDWSGTCSWSYAGDICLSLSPSVSGYDFVGKGGHHYRAWLHWVKDGFWSVPVGIEFAVPVEEHDDDEGDPVGDLEITNLVVESSDTYRVEKDLRGGLAYYVDRDYVLTDVPQEVSTGLWIQTANDDKYQESSSFLSFDVNRDVGVFVGYDRRADSLPSWLRSFQQVGASLGVSDGGADRLILYKKKYSAGERIVLGGNAGKDTGASSNYVVVAKEQITGSVESAEREKSKEKGYRPFQNLR